MRSSLLYLLILNKSRNYLIFLKKVFERKEFVCPFLLLIASFYDKIYKNFMERVVKPTILVSRCLMGDRCRYDGKSNACDAVQRLAERYRIIPVCPECDGGLPVPRAPSERRGTQVLMQDGRDVTDAFTRGAEHALSLARAHRIAFAVLKANSPSCGKGEIYDGSFTHTRVRGNGVTAELLMQSGYRVLTEKEVQREIL